MFEGKKNEKAIAHLKERAFQQQKMFINNWHQRSAKKLSRKEFLCKCPVDINSILNTQKKCFVIDDWDSSAGRAPATARGWEKSFGKAPDLRSKG